MQMRQLSLLIGWAHQRLLVLHWMPLSWPRPRATSRFTRHFPHLLKPESVCSGVTVSFSAVRSSTNCSRRRTEAPYRVFYRFASAGAPTNMNIFRLTGDLSHLAAIIILLLKIWKTRSCAGESSHTFTSCLHDPVSCTLYVLTCKCTV